MSKRFTLNREDLKKIGKGAIIAVLGALLTYLSKEITNMDFGEYTAVVMAFWSVFTNIAWKYLEQR
jgi:hypothetical protein